MRHPLDDAATIFDASLAENEKGHLGMLWHSSDFEPICFVSIDVEGPFDAITELGLSFQRKNEPRRGRHFVVKSTQDTKSRAPRPLGFGLASEYIDQPEDLCPILEDFFVRRLRENLLVVLTGFTMKADLVKIERACGWLPRTDVPLIDSAAIFKVLSGRNKHPSLEMTLQRFGYRGQPSAPFHNAANDAWYALELLLLEAEQALKQILDPDGPDTIDWMKSPDCPPNSPTMGGPLSPRLSTLGPYRVTLPAPPAATMCETSLPVQQPQMAHTPGAESSTAPHRKRNRGSRGRGGKGKATGDGGAAATVSPDDDAPPAKKQKLTHEASEEKSKGDSGDEKPMEGIVNGEKDLAFRVKVKNES